MTEADLPVAKPPLLEVKNLKKYFTSPARSLSVPWGGERVGDHVVKAVDDVNLVINQGETLGLVGESGSGKSTLGRCILRLIEPTSGSIIFNNISLLDLPPQEMRKRRVEMQIVFQDPLASLNPRMTIGSILREPLAVHQIVKQADIRDEVIKLLEMVGLPADSVNRYPHEFSGGQRQRIGIARAISLRPKLIVADEPVSALDVSIRAQILNLFRRIQKETGVAYLFIAHDLGSIRQLSDNVAVMYLGKVVEYGPSEALFNNPQHPYTTSLLNAAPTIESIKLKRQHNAAHPGV